jgi:hypothetical protein
LACTDEAGDDVREYQSSPRLLCPETSSGLPTRRQVLPPESVTLDTEYVPPVYMLMLATSRSPPALLMGTLSELAADVSVAPASCTKATEEPPPDDPLEV